MARLKTNRLSLIIAIIVGLVFVKTTYAYYNLGAFWSQPSAATGYKLAFISTAQTISNTWTCSTAVNVQTQYSNGSALTVSAATTVSLSYTAGGGLFYSDSGCTTQVTSFTIASGATSGTFYFKLGKTGTNTIQSSASGFTSATQNETGTNLIAYTWLGSSSNNFGTASNWSNGSGGTHTTAPSSTTNVYFDNNCTSAYCSPTVAAAISVKGLYMMPTYTGTINVGSYTLTIASSGALSVGGGTLTQGSGNWSINSAATTTIYGGNVNGGSGTIACGTFTQTGGTVTLSSSNSTNTFTPSSTVTLSGGSLIGGAGLMSFSSTTATHLIQGGTLTVGAGGLTVSGNLTLSSGTLNGGSGALTIAKTTTQSGGTWNGSSGDITLSSTSATFTMSGGTFAGGSGRFLVSKNISQTSGSFTVPSGLTSVSGTHTISGGTFNGASGTIQTVSTLTFSGGNITATSNTWTIQNALTVTGSPTFSHNSGTVVFARSNGAATLSPGSINFNNVTFAGSTATYTVSGTMSVYGAFVVGDSVGGAINTGTINVYGSSLTANQSYVSGTATVVAAGNASGQTITGSSGSFPNLTINAGTNSVTLSGTVPIQRHFTYSSAGTWTTTGSNLYLHNFTTSSSNTPVYTPGSVSYNDVTIESLNDTVTVSGTMNIAGNLYIGDQSNYGGSVINSGTLSVAGDVVVKNYGYASGTTVVKMVGKSSSASVISTTGGNNPYLPYVTVAAGSNNITVSGTVNVIAGWTMTSVGTLNATNSTLNVGLGNYSQPVTFSAGNVDYGNVNINSAAEIYLGGANANIYGNLNLIMNYWASLNNGTLNCYGADVRTSMPNGYGSGNPYTSIGSGLVVAKGNAAGGDQVVGSSYNDVNSYFAFSNLTIDAASKSIVFLNKVYVTGSYQVINIGSMTTISSTLMLGDISNSLISIKPGSTPRYNNVSFFGCHTGFDLNSQTFNIDGDLYFDDYCGGGQDMSNGTINVKGNITSRDGSPGRGSNLTINLTGNASGSILDLAGSLPGLIIATGSNTVTVSGTSTIGSYFEYQNSGTFTTSGSVVVFGGAYAGNIFKPGSAIFDQLKIYGYCMTTDFSGQTVNVSTSLTLDDSCGAGVLNNGTIDLKGNFTSTPYFDGSAQILMSGASPTITQNNGSIQLNMTLAISGEATLATNFDFGSGYNQSDVFSITSGSLNMSGHNFTVGQTGANNSSALNLSTGTVIKRNGGVLTVQGATIGAGSYSSGTIN